eukprot:6469822-Amphidinium_carterae.1
METLARLALLPVVEISIEAKHAFAKSKLRDKTNVSASLFSLALRMPSLRKFLQDSPSHSCIISDHMAELRKKIDFVALFGMQDACSWLRNPHTHPDARQTSSSSLCNLAMDLECIQRLLHSDTPLSWKSIRHAFYHCDAESQFTPVRAMKQRRVRRNVPAEVLYRGVCRSGRGSGNKPSRSLKYHCTCSDAARQVSMKSPDELCFHRAVIAHVKEKLEPGSYVTVPCDDNLYISTEHKPLTRLSSANFADVQFSLGRKGMHLMLQVVRLQPSLIKGESEANYADLIAVVIHRIVRKHSAASSAASEENHLLISLDPWPEVQTSAKKTPKDNGLMSTLTVLLPKLYKLIRVLSVISCDSHGGKSSIFYWLPTSTVDLRVMLNAAHRWEPSAELKVSCKCIVSRCTLKHGFQFLLVSVIGYLLQVISGSFPALPQQMLETVLSLLVSQQAFAPSYDYVDVAPRLEVDKLRDLAILEVLNALHAGHVVEMTGETPRTQSWRLSSSALQYIAVALRPQNNTNVFLGNVPALAFNDCSQHCMPRLVWKSLLFSVPRPTPAYADLSTYELLAILLSTDFTLECYPKGKSRLHLLPWQP